MTMDWRSSLVLKPKTIRFGAFSSIRKRICMNGGKLLFRTQPEMLQPANTLLIFSWMKVRFFILFVLIFFYSEDNFLLILQPGEVNIVSRLQVMRMNIWSTTINLSSLVTYQPASSSAITLTEHYIYLFPLHFNCAFASSGCSTFH